MVIHVDLVDIIVAAVGALALLWMLAVIIVQTIRKRGRK